MLKAVSVYQVEVFQHFKHWIKHCTAFTGGYQLNWHIFLVVQLVKKSDCNAGYLGQEHPLEKGVATHSSILGWRIP